LQQKQLRAAINIDEPLDRKTCALAVVHYRSKLNNYYFALRPDPSKKKYEEFMRLVKASGIDEATGAFNLILSAVATGVGGRIRILPFNVNAYVRRSLEKGTTLKVQAVKFVENSCLVKAVEVT
jgi:hypothetical protein